MGAEFATSVGGRYDKHLGIKNPDLEVEAIGSNRYQAAVLITRGSGEYSTGRKLHSRGTAEEECGSSDGNENEEWDAIRINDWLLALKVGSPPNVLVSPFEIFEVPMEINR